MDELWPGLLPPLIRFHARDAAPTGITSILRLKSQKHIKDHRQSQTC